MEKWEFKYFICIYISHNLFSTKYILSTDEQNHGILKRKKALKRTHLIEIDLPNITSPLCDFVFIFEFPLTYFKSNLFFLRFCLLFVDKLLNKRNIGSYTINFYFIYFAWFFFLCF